MLGVAVVVGLGVLGGTLSRARTPELAPRRVAAAVFENRTGRPDLDDLGAMTADWIIRGLMETPLIDLTDLEAIYARGNGRFRGPDRPLALARRNGAGLVILGTTTARATACCSRPPHGRGQRPSATVLRPVGAPLGRATTALEALRERIAGGLGPLVNPVEPGYRPSIPTWFRHQPRLPTASSLPGLERGGSMTGTPRPSTTASGQLDSTFVAPLIQLALRGFLRRGMSPPDSVGPALDSRRDS